MSAMTRDEEDAVLAQAKEITSAGGLTTRPK
jgi:hypothetical protein